MLGLEIQQSAGGRAVLPLWGQGRGGGRESRCEIISLECEGSIS